MTRNSRAAGTAAFTLAEVVVAMGIVAVSVLATIGLLVVGNDTNKRARDEGLAAQLAANEFGRLNSLGATSSFWTTRPLDYTRYYNSSLTDLGTDRATAMANGAVYELQMSFIEAPSTLNPNPTSTPPVGTADVVANAEVRYPAAAPAANQNSFKFVTLMNFPNG